MIFCYLISQDTAKFSKVKHLIFIFWQNNFAVVAYKDISMLRLSFQANFIKNTQKFFSPSPGENFSGPDCTSSKCQTEPSFPHPESVFPAANALNGDQHVWKHLEHCNSDSSDIHSSSYVLCTQSLNQEWLHTSNEPNYH